MFPNRLVAVMNEKIEPGVIMNALAHASLALGAQLDAETLHLTNYIDADGGDHISSKMPYIILKANSNKIRGLRQAALSAKIQHIDFINTMTGGTYADQIEKTKSTRNEDLIYYGIILFGDPEKVTELTRKFSLWR